MGRDRYKALALSGGGCRGIIQAALLSRVDLSGLDAVAGTSAGSGTAAAIASGVRGQDLVRIFEENAWDIFRYHFFRRVNPLAVNYSGRDMLKALERVLDVPLGDLKIPCYIPASGYGGRAKVFDRTDDWTAAEACRASMSAPHMFPPFKKDGAYWIDGGLWASDPTAVLAAAVRDKEGADPDRTDVMTVMNGHHTPAEKAGDPPKTRLGWLPRLIPYITRGNETAARYIARRMPLGSLTVYEDPPVRDYWGLDRPDRMEEMKKEALKGLDDFKRAWDDFMLGKKRGE